MRELDIMGALLFGQGQLTAEFGGSATPGSGKEGHAAGKADPRQNRPGRKDWRARWAV